MNIRDKPTIGLLAFSLVFLAANVLAQPRPVPQPRPVSPRVTVPQQATPPLRRVNPGEPPRERIGPPPVNAGKALGDLAKLNRHTRIGSNQMRSDSGRNSNELIG